MTKMFQKFLYTFVLGLFAFALLAYFTPAFAEGCSYENHISPNKYAVTETEPFTVTFTVVRKGDLQLCDNYTIIYFYFLNDKNRSVKFDSKGAYFTGTEAKAGFEINPSTSFKGKLGGPFYSSPGVLQMFGSANTKIGQATSGTISVRVNNVSQSSGKLEGTVSLGTKPTYNSGDAVQVKLHITNPSEIDKLDSSYAQLYIIAKVNGTTIGGFAKEKAAFKADQYIETTVSTDKGFKNGTNTVIVDLYDANTKSLKLITASATVQATGLSSTSGPGTGPGAGSGPGTGPGAGGPGTGPGDGSGQGGDQGGAGGNGNQGGGQGYESIQSPITATSIGALIIRAINYLLALVASVAVLAIVIGGFRLVIANGNEQQLMAGKKGIIWAIVGLVVSVMAYTIVSVLQDLLQKK